ncbi:MAG: amidohydrolase [Chloroflexota bacterium]|nr:amidohydrolase [Chloroflexota bacterium]
MIIDTETHIMYFARNSRTNAHSSRTKHHTWHEHDADLLVQEMDAAGVDRTFLISYDAEDTRWSSEHHGFTMEDFAGGRKYTLQGVRQFPNRFYWFNTIKDPRLYPTLDLIEQDLADGATGFKLFPAYIQATLDEPAWLAIFTRIRERGSRLLVSLETLRPPESYSLSEYVQQLDRVLSEVPDLPIALLHAGCADPLKVEGHLIVDLCLRHQGVYLSTSMAGEIWDDGTEYPYRNLLARVERLRNTVGIDRLMWATDWPWFEDCFLYRQGLDAFRRHADFLAASELDAFLGGNARRFIDEVAQSPRLLAADAASLRAPSNVPA